MNNYNNQDLNQYEQGDEFASDEFSNESLAMMDEMEQVLIDGDKLGAELQHRENEKELKKLEDAGYTPDVGNVEI